MAILRNTHGALVSDIVINQITYDDKIEATPTGTISCTISGSLSDALASAPEIGSSTEHFPETTRTILGATYTVRLVLTSRKFTVTEAGVVSVTLDYAVHEEESAGNGSESSLTTSYSLSSTKASYSILQNSIYDDVPEKEKVLAKALIDGVKPYETVYLNKSALEIKTSITEDEEENYKETTLSNAISQVVTSDKGKELVSKINAGVKKFEAYGCSFDETSYSSALSASLKSLGKQSSPPNAAPAGDWVMTGLKAEKEKGENRWKITKTWTSSPSGVTLDGSLYSSEEGGQK